MLKNFVIIATRNFVRQPIYFIINISGLVVGLTCCIFILLWISNEYSYDQFHRNKDLIFQVLVSEDYPTGEMITPENTPGPLAEALKEELPEIEETCRTSWISPILFRYDKQLACEKGYYADKSIFKIFTFPILAGNINNLLPDNNSIVISEKIAAKYFPKESAIGKILRIQNQWEAKVTGVFKNIPRNSTLQFDFVLPFDRYDGSDNINNWKFNTVQTYAKLRSADSQNEVNEKISNFIESKVEGSPTHFFLFPLSDWWLYTDFDGTKAPNGRIKYVISFSMVAILILVSACINFMNLATARAAKRSREIGIRKVAGASRTSLIKQFMVESTLLSLISLFIALLFAHLLMPLFNNLISKSLRIDYANTTILVSLIGITLLTSFIAGSYPALFLSSYRPASVLKGDLQSSFKGAGLRKALVIFQFGLSLVLILCSVVIHDQTNYLINKDLGFKRDNIVYFSGYTGTMKNFEAFRNELLQSSIITHVALGENAPMNMYGDGDFAEWDVASKDQKILFKGMPCDYDYLTMFDFTFLEGRNFSRDVASDSANFIITEESAKRMGFYHPIGQSLKYLGREGQIIGVVNDFHSKSVRYAIEPVIFTLRPEDTGSVFVRFEQGKLKEAMVHLQVIYKKFEPDFPLEYEFISNESKGYYQEEFLGNLSLCFTVIAISISCLGLFGLTLFTTQRRTKEIGVRKILGASAGTIIIMLCRDFSKPILYSIVLGCSVAYYIMQEFLSQYAFHTELQISVFIITTLSMVTMALVTVIYQTSKAALNNPVDVLRME